MINVYDIGNDNYTGNGDAVLTPTDAKIKMVAGGNYDMSMTHPIDPDGKWQHLVPGAILRVPVPAEEIENAFAGLEADVYKVTTATDLREGPTAPSTISYTAWSISTDYAVGAKVTHNSRNYQCNYFDETSAWAHISPDRCSWWTEIARSTPGAAVLVNLPIGSELYFVEDYNTDWYKMSTYYGIVGYVEKSKVTYDRHLTPIETKPRIITEQLLRITNATVDTKNKTVSVTAQHVSYDLNGVIIKDISISVASPGMALARIVDGFMIPYPGTIATNLDSEEHGTYTGDIKGKSGMYALLDPDKGIVGTFDAAFRRDNWDLFVMEKTDTDRGFQLRRQKNLLGVNWSRKSDSLINRVVPVAKDAGGADLFLPEVWIDSPDISDYPVVRMEMLSMKEQVGKDKGTGDGSTWTEADLLDEMRTKAAERFSVDKVDKIITEVTVDFEMLGATVEHPEMKALESVLLYDKVRVIDESIGLDTQLTVTELEYDALKKKVTSIKISNAEDRGGRSVTGYNVQSKSIGWSKLTDEVQGDILNQVKDLIPEYTDPEAARPGLPNTVSQDGVVTKGQGQANKVWKTDADGNPAWRDDSGGSGSYIPTNEKGAAGGVATLDDGGKVPASELPSYVDDVLEYASRNNFPATGENGKIYVATDTNKSYRWSGSTYIELSTTAVNDSDPTLAWGTRSKVGDVAGTDLHVTMPANPVDSLTENTNDPTDSDYTVKVGSPSKKVTFLRVWNYIKSKISSVLGLTVSSYGGKAATAGDADTVNGKTVGKNVPADAVFTDTKNTAGSTDSSSKLFLIGATSQAANPQTYSHDTAYVGTDGCLYSGSTKVKTEQTAVSDPSADGTGITFIDTISQNTQGVITPHKRTVRTMTGASSSADGATGLVPKPTSGNQGKFLRADGTWQAANNYTLPLAANGTRGGVQVGYTQSGQNYPVQLSSEKAYVNVPWTADGGDAATVNGKTVGKSVPSDAVFTDTKNTAGSTDSSSKLFLIGATSQAANPQTYSHDTAYVGTDGCLYSGGVKVLTAHQDISSKLDKTYNTLSSFASESDLQTILFAEIRVMSASSRKLVRAQCTTAFSVFNANTSYFFDISKGSSVAYASIAIAAIGGPWKYSYYKSSDTWTLVEFKQTQTAVSDPSADGNDISFIDSISQNTQGVITPHKKNVRSASASQSGVVTTGSQTFAGEKSFTGRVNSANGNSSVDITKSNNGISSNLDGSVFRIVDKNSAAIGYLGRIARTTGEIGVSLVAHNIKTSDSSDVWNAIICFANKDGSCTYSVTSPANFRSAIGLGVSDITGITWVSGKTPSHISAKKQLNIVTISAYWNPLNRPTTDEWVKIGSMPSGSRPGQDFMVSDAQHATGASAFAIRTNGDIVYYVSTAQTQNATMSMTYIAVN